MAGKITAKRLTYSAGAFILASSLLTSNLYYFAGNDSWLPVIAGFAASLAIVGVYSRLSKLHPGMGLAEINEAVFGKIAGKAVSTLYVLYFFSLVCFNLRDLGDFVKGYLLPNTPMAAIVAAFIAVCACAVKKGAEKMTRYAFLLFAFSVAGIALNSLLLLDRVDLENLKPVLARPAIDYFIGTHIVVMLPFCEILAFMMLLPEIESAADFTRGIIKGLMSGAAILLLVVLRDVCVLGKYCAVFSMPTFSSIRYIDVGDILTRLEIVYATILISLLFFKVSVVYFATVSGAAKIAGLSSHKALVLVLGALAVVYSMASFKSLDEHVKWNLTAAATYSTFFILVLPAATWLVSAVRNKLENQSASG